MINSYAKAQWALLLLLAPSGGVFAQAPTITTVIPMANARAASRTSPVTVSFNQPLTASSAAALKVHSAQRGGLRTRATTPATVSGSTISFSPATPFMPGEKVQYTVTATAASTTGNLAQPRVGQFTTAVGGGTGVFGGGVDISLGTNVGTHLSTTAIGDIDSDGDLDMLVANGGGATGILKTLLNNGSGTFNSGPDINIPGSPREIAFGDIDGDGDLDFLCVGVNSSSMTVRLNDGSGGFSTGQSLYMSLFPASVKLGDADGDGDLDSFVTNSYGNTVSVRLNDGNGGFSGGQEVAVAAYPSGLAVGDIDSDGDVDLITGNTLSNNLSIRLNDGNGAFSGSQNLSSANANSVLLSDVDGDNDLDLIVGSVGSIEIYSNDGVGLFSRNQNILSGSGAPMTLSVASGDVDGDSDLDLVVTTSTNNGISAVGIYLNNGNGVFSASPNPGTVPLAETGLLADVDGDGDLDMVTTNTSGAAGTVSVRFNSNTTLATIPKGSAATLVLYPNPAHRAAVLTGVAPNTPCQVLDALGRVVLTTTADATGTAHLTLPASMAAGAYLVRSGGQVRRLLVE